MAVTKKACMSTKFTDGEKATRSCGICTDGVVGAAFDIWRSLIKTLHPATCWIFTTLRWRLSWLLTKCDLHCTIWIVCMFSCSTFYNFFFLFIHFILKKHESKNVFIRKSVSVLLSWSVMLESCRAAIPICSIKNVHLV